MALGIHVHKSFLFSVRLTTLPQFNSLLKVFLHISIIFIFELFQDQAISIIWPHLVHT